MLKGIGYIRVSTAKQGASGLGLAAQKEAIERYCQTMNFELENLFVEVQSGADNSRAQLQKAMEASIGKLLIVAKLDRLSRDVEFVAKHIKLFKDSDVKFVAVDRGYNASDFELQLFATFAELEREQGRLRTIAAQAEARKRGVIFGNPNIALINHLGREANKAKAMDHANSLKQFIEPLIKQGLSNIEIAKTLNLYGKMSRLGKPFSEHTIGRVRKKWTN
jgi:DNA invertase Pin-like site-specific DNA recombinase